MSVYLMRAVGTNRCKIGYSSNVRARRGQIGGECAGYEVETLMVLDGNKDDERKLHRWLANRGEDLAVEWFDLTPDLVQVFKDTAQEIINVPCREEPIPLPVLSGRRSVSIRFDQEDIDYCIECSGSITRGTRKAIRLARGVRELLAKGMTGLSLQAAVDMVRDVTGKEV